MLRQLIRRLAPLFLRRMLAQARRRLRDRRSGIDAGMLGCAPAPRHGLATCVKISQPIRQTAHFQGKLHNLRMAAKVLDGIAIPPGKIFSFWTLVGEPSARNGFQLGRAIRGDVLSTDIGGGLCQISGLAYELGLRAGLAVVERHAHTQDLYTNESRFTPLGLDATIVWGFKDLRLRNDFLQTVTLAFEVRQDRICGKVLAQQPFAPAQLVISCDEACDGTSRIATVGRIMAHGQACQVSRDVYAVPAFLRQFRPA